MLRTPTDYEREIIITIPGHPATKKNSLIMVPGRSLILPSRRWQAYQRAALGTKRRPGPLAIAWLGKETIMVPVNLQAVYWLRDKRQPDLLNLLAGTADLLQAARVIADDKQIISLDGSRIAGIDKANPRVEITLTVWRMGP